MNNMTIEKAIEILKRVDGIECKFEGYTTALGIAVQALERQVPKKLINPKKISNRRWADCCYCKLTLSKPCRFCPRCGQALDWSDENA